MCHAFGFPYKQRLASQLPMGIYTIPEISAVGETEESCKEKKIPYEAGRAKYSNNARGQIIGDTAGLLKLIFRPDNKQLLGVQILGESATELIHLLSMASSSNPAAQSTHSSNWFSIFPRSPNCTNTPPTMASQAM